MTKQTEKWTRDELKGLIRSLSEHAKENRRQARDEDRDRAKYLEGGAEAFDHAVSEIRRILRGQTNVEAMAERLAPHMSPRAKG